MVFSDPLFIFGFLPAFLLLYVIVAERYRNAYVFLASFAFYWWGEQNYQILLFSILLNYTFGVVIHDLKLGIHETRAVPSPLARVALWIGVLTNLGVLCYYKYAGFLTGNLRAIEEALHGAQPLTVWQVALPLGVSFFVFQGISYLVDVWRGVVRPTRSLLKFATYKILFPQLIAGPIVRYAEVSREMDDRTATPSAVFVGTRRFVVGFVKKVLLADTFAATADAIFAQDPSSLSTGAAWLGPVCYALQIYFDFSAYSDMAIGIGAMLGFHYPENFNYPYVSSSIREFWRRWHMTLSFWFRDYVYLPLGGNRVGPIRTYVNLLAVFVLTGFWHGPSWTFMVWGLWHGLFMVIERRFDPDTWPIPRVARHLYALGVVLFGWVLFRADSFEQALGLFGRMVGLRGAGAVHGLTEYVTPLLAVSLLVGAVVACPVYALLVRAIPGPRLRITAGTLVFGGLFALACAKVLSGAYSPFLYFRF